MFGPGILWTAAHERIPLLYIVHNNRCYHTEIMQLQAIANRRQRGIDRVHIGCAIDNPNINYAMMAKSLGVHGEGPHRESARSRAGAEARDRHGEAAASRRWWMWFRRGGNAGAARCDSPLFL